MSWYIFNYIHAVAMIHIIISISYCNLQKNILSALSRIFCRAWELNDDGGPNFRSSGNPQTLSLKEPYGTLAFGFPDASATGSSVVRN